MLSDILPEGQIRDFIGPYVENRNLVWAFGVQVAIASLLQLVSQLFSVGRTLGVSDFLSEGLPALGPLVQWVIAVSFTFGNTEWAWQNPILALLLLLPSFCYINAK